MIGVGVIGYGYWGPNLVRNFAETQGAAVVAVSDSNPKRLDLVAARFPYVQTSADAETLIANTNVDLVAISTPVDTHFELAMKALKAGKHVLVEKPLTRTEDEALRLLDEAARRNLRIAVDHTFVFTGAVRKIRELVEQGELGDLYYYDSTRINLGLFQRDVDVIWDLAVHDLAIMDHLLPQHPVAVSATGLSHVPGRTENIAYLTLFFEQQMIAHVNVNWLSPVKVRRTMLSGSKKMVVYDDLEITEKVKVYDKGITLRSSEDFYQALVGYRTGDMWAPQLDTTEALTMEARNIIQAIETGGALTADGWAGLRTVRVLEAATASMKNRGNMIELRAAKVGA